LFPPGVQNIRDLPWRWFEAIRLAMYFIGFDELPDDERPPRRIWLDSEQLQSWFVQVKADRDRKYGTGDKLGAIEDPKENAAAGSLVVG
jgi:hypothetical protein